MGWWPGVTGLGDDAEVVCDHQHAHFLLILQFVDEIEELGLRRHVERGGRLVGDDEIRFTREADGEQSVAGSNGD